MPRPLYPLERPSTHCIGGWVGPRTVWMGTENLAPLEFDPQTIQPLASRYTNWAVLAHRTGGAGQKTSLTSSSLAVYIPLVHMCLDTCICMHHPEWLCTFLWFACVWTPVFACIILTGYVQSLVHVFGHMYLHASSSLAVYIPLVHMCLDTCICMHHSHWLCTFLWFTCVWPDYHIRGSPVNMSDESQKAHDLRNMILCHSVLDVSK